MNPRKMVSKHFILQEFVTPEIFSKYSQSCTWFLDPKMIEVADFLRDFLKSPMTINNWDSGGTLSLRGFRPPDTSLGAVLSQHKFGRAFDSNCNDRTPQEVYQLILQNETLFLNAGLTTLEDIESTPTWLHCDVRYTGLNRILIVKP